MSFSWSSQAAQVIHSGLSSSLECWERSEQKCSLFCQREREREQKKVQKVQTCRSDERKHCLLLATVDNYKGANVGGKTQISSLYIFLSLRPVSVSPVLFCFFHFTQTHYCFLCIFRWNLWSSSSLHPQIFVCVSIVIVPNHPPPLILLLLASRALKVWL